MHGLFEQSHEILSYLLAALVLVHIAARCGTISSSAITCWGACRSAKRT